MARKLIMITLIAALCAVSQGVLGQGTLLGRNLSGNYFHALSSISQSNGLLADRGAKLTLVVDLDTNLRSPESVDVARQGSNTRLNLCLTADLWDTNFRFFVQSPGSESADFLAFQSAMPLSPDCGSAGNVDLHVDGDADMVTLVIAPE